jgi:class 3 adenylate cyclase
MRCANCGSDNPTDSAFCEQCGRRLEQLCPACKAPVSAGARFCRKCGTSLRATAIHSEAIATKSSGTRIRLLPEQTGTSTIADGERKMVTALFADIKGSTELIERLDPEEARTIVDPALRIMVEAVRRYDGYVVQSTGDGIFVLFGAPAAHEDHPQRALYAALRMQEDLRGYSARVVSEGGTPVPSRVGVNTGEVVVRGLETGQGHAEYAPIGHSVNLAARMQTAAPVVSIAATETTRKLCEGFFTFKLLGPTLVKGVSEPVNVWEVTGLGLLRNRLQRAASRGLTRFVGREARWRRCGTRPGSPVPAMGKLSRRWRSRAWANRAYTMNSSSYPNQIG